MLEDGRVVSGAGGQHDLVSHGAGARRRTLHHRGAQLRDGRIDARSPTSCGATPTPPCRATCATSSSPSTASPTCAASPTATASPPCWPSPTAASSRRCATRRSAPASWSDIRAVRAGATPNAPERHGRSLRRRAARRHAARVPARHEMTETEQSLAAALSGLSKRVFGSLSAPGLPVCRRLPSTRTRCNAWTWRRRRPCGSCAARAGAWRAPAGPFRLVGSERRAPRTHAARAR